MMLQVPTTLRCTYVMQAGCAVQPNFFEVETCPEEVGGGFRPPDGVRGMPAAALPCTPKSNIYNPVVYT